MATVPIYETHVADDATLKGAAAPLPSRDFGTDLVEGGQAVAGALDKESEIFDDAAAQQLDVQYTAYAREQLYGTNGLFAKQGINALNAAPAVQQALQDKRDEIIAQATTQRQRMMLGNTLGARLNSSLDNIASFRTSQTRDWAKASNAAAQLNESDEYSTTFMTDPVAAQEHLDAAVHYAKLGNAYNGGDADTEQQAVLGVTSRAHTQVIDNILAKGDPVAADHYFQAVQGQIDPVTRAQFSEKLRRASNVAGAKAATDSQAASGAALAQVPVAGGNAVGAGQPVLPRGNYAEQIRKVGADTGHDLNAQNTVVAIGMIESGLNPHPKNNGSSTGGFQFHPDTFSKILPGGDINNPIDQIRAAYKLYDQNHDALVRALGREPSAMELYMAHQQGLPGAEALLRAPPQMSAIAAVAPVYGGDMARARRAIVDNHGTPDSTVGQFIQLWQGKVLRRTGQVTTAAGPAINPASGGVLALPDRDAFVNSVVALAGGGSDPASLDRQAAFRSEAESRWSQMHEAKVNAEQEATAAVQPLLRTDTIKSYSAFVAAAGPDVMSRLSQTTQTAIYDRFSGRDDDGQPKTSDRTTVAALHDLYTSDPTAFSRIDLTHYSGQLNNEDWHDVLGKQDALRKGQDPDKAHQITWDRINAAANDTFNDLQLPHGAKANPAQNATYANAITTFKTDMLSRVVIFQKANGRPPNAQEIHGMAIELTQMQVHTRGSAAGGHGVGGAGPAMPAVVTHAGQAPYVPLENIPPAAVARIRRDYQAKHGSLPTQAWIEDYYPVAHSLGRL